MYRPLTMMGPYVLDGETFWVRRHGPDSAPHTLPVPNSRLWELLEADPDDPTSPRVGARCAMVVRPNDEDDATALHRLLGERVPVVFKPGWGDGGSRSSPTP